MLCGCFSLMVVLLYQWKADHKCAAGKIRFVVAIAFDPNIALQRLYDTRSDRESKPGAAAFVIGAAGGMQFHRS